MVIVIAITFIVSWSPQYMVTLVSQLQSHSFLRESNFIFTMLMTHFFGFLNSCINPIIYTAMSERFRRSFKDIMSHVFCCFMHGSRFLFGHMSSNRTRFTSTLRHTFSETEGNTIALRDNLYENSYMNRKCGSKSSSSGTDSDKFVFSRESHPKKYVHVFKCVNQNGSTLTSDNEVQKPLIQHNVSASRQTVELKSILKNSPTQRKPKDYSSYIECDCLCPDSPQNVAKPACLKLDLATPDDSINQNSVCFFQDEGMNGRVVCMKS